MKEKRGRKYRTVTLRSSKLKQGSKEWSQKTETTLLVFMNRKVGKDSRNCKQGLNVTAVWKAKHVDLEVDC